MLNPQKSKTGVSHDNPRAQTWTLGGPGASNTTKILRKDPPREEERIKNVAGEGKKSDTWAVRRRWGPAEGGRAEVGRAEGRLGERPNLRHTHGNFEHTPPTQHNTTQHNKNKNRSGQNTCTFALVQKHFWPPKIGPSRIGLTRTGPSRLGLSRPLAQLAKARIGPSRSGLSRTCPLLFLSFPFVPFCLFSYVFSPHVPFCLSQPPSRPLLSSFLPLSFCSGPPSPGPPKNSLFSSNNFHSIFPLLGVFVEFWWCLKRQQPEMCTFEVFGAVV